jgi:hypothetical protein
MTLIAPSLADMGVTLFGNDWEEPLADLLNVREEQIRAWDRDPVTIPPGLEEEIQSIGRVRLAEIQVMLTQMRATGLRREPVPDA